MSEEEKKQIESSFRAIFNKIKNQLREELKAEQNIKDLEDYGFKAPGNTVQMFGFLGIEGAPATPKKHHPELQDRNTITTDEIIEFSQNLSKIKQIHGKEKLEN